MMCIETVQSELAKKLNLFNEAWEKKMWQVFLLTTLRYNRNWGFHNLCISGRVRPKMKGADNERSGLVKNQKGTLHETLHSIHCWVKWHKGPQKNRDQLTMFWSSPRSHRASCCMQQCLSSIGSAFSLGWHHTQLKSAQVKVPVLSCCMQWRLSNIGPALVFVSTTLN